MTSPLVSILVPCYGDRATLPMALASLVAQTVDDWECIVVDDGSTPPVEPVVERFDDDRFRLRRLSKNRGRAIARQTGLQMARGEFVAMLDADDWCYPNRLERQLELLDGYGELAAVACGVCVIDDREQLTGVRSFGDADPEIRIGSSTAAPSVSFPTMMFRRKVAMSADFDPQLRRGEDGDYLMKALGGRRFGVTQWIGYAYRDYYSPAMVDEALLAFRCQRRLAKSRMSEAPLRFGALYAASWVRTGVYRTARISGRGKWLFDRRNRPATSDVRQRFERQRRTVEEALP